MNIIRKYQISLGSCISEEFAPSIDDPNFSKKNRRLSKQYKTWLRNICNLPDGFRLLRVYREKDNKKYLEVVIRCDFEEEEHYLILEKIHHFVTTLSIDIKNCVHCLLNPPKKEVRIAGVYSDYITLTSGKELSNLSAAFATLNSSLDYDAITL